MMKKQAFFVVMVASLAALGAVSCSTTPKQSAGASAEMSRKLASPDVGLIGPSGEVLLFYKEGGEIVVKQCGDYTVLNRREDCKGKAVRVPVGEFKERLKMALRLPLGDYAPEMKRKIELYKKGKLDDIADLERQRADMKSAIGEIQRFIDNYGRENADLNKLSSLEGKLKTIEQKLADNADLTSAIREINRLIDRLVDVVIASPKLEKYLYSQNKQGFEFNVLRTYVRSAALNATFAKIPKGVFMMGSPEGEKNRYSDETLHQVTLTKGFEMQTTEVTQLQWFLVMGYNPSYFKAKENCPEDYVEINGTALCSNHPVEQVSWNDVQSFLQKLNAQEDGYAYRLPTEAEWEYAARAGTQTAYYFDESKISENAWFSGNSGSTTHAVGTKNPNAYGLYDMSGNVWEWAQDFYSDYSKNSVTDPMGLSGSFRVFRGGSWGDLAHSLRSAFRDGGAPGFRWGFLGFRLVRTF